MNYRCILASLPVGLIAGAQAFAAGPGFASSPESPDVAVPVVRYQSVFALTKTPTADPASTTDETPRNPATEWRRANETVGQYRRGHVDILRAESASQMAPSSPPTPTQERP